MNTSLATFPSCLNYLMEDRIAAHKLSGMRTAKMLSDLCWSLSRPDVLSGPLITRQMIPVDHPALPHHHSCRQSGLTVGSHVLSRLRSLPAPQATRLSQAQLHKSTPSCVSADSVTVMQWNVLSQGKRREESFCW